MTGLRPSRYNVRAVTTDGGVRYANTRTGAIIHVGPRADQLLGGIDPGIALPALEAGVIEDLTRWGLLVPAGTDEVAQVVDDYEHTRRQRHLALTISPTVACNLRCGYCFETGHPNRYMHDDDMHRVVAFVRRQLASHPASFSVTWFGGEPLLHLTGIERLSKAFVNAATFAGAAYSASIITNGTLLEDETVSRLLACRVRAAQISLDGGRSSHELLRIDTHGRGSYDKVLAGLRAAAGRLHLVLRIHVDRRTARTIPPLLDELASLGLQSVSPAFVRIEPPAVFRHEPGQPTPRPYLTVSEFAELETAFIAQAAGLGFPAVPTISSPHGPAPCAAVSEHHYALEPGHLVKRCWIDVADDTTSVGTLADDGSVALGPGDAPWRAYLPFDLGCADCTYLPLCVGGCPKARVAGALGADGDEADKRRFKEDFVCSPRKRNLVHLLERGLVR